MFRSFAVIALLLLPAGLAHAEGPFEGTWREGAMNIDVSVQSWGGDCGPRPQSTGTGGGGSFPITQDGDELTFHLRRQRTTRGCWSENRAVRRVSSTHQSGTWRIVCRTPADDSRGETGTYTIQSIGDDRLTFRDVSAYDWQLNESRCVATITTTQTFTRISAAPVAQTPRQERCTPGAAARLSLRPSSAELSPGGQQCFTPRVVDANDCPLPSPDVQMSLAEGSPGRLDGRCYRAPDGQGQARVLAQSGALRGEARIVVRTMDLSDLIALRSESGSVGSGAPGPDAHAQTSARVSARSRERGFPLVWLALGIGAALLLAAGAFLLVRRPKRAQIGGLRGVEIPEPAASAPGLGAEGPDMICPTCRRGFPPGTLRCAHDQTMLVAYTDFAAGKASGTARQNVCPTCGEHYPAHVKFCGKDGTTLEGSGG